MAANEVRIIGGKWKRRKLKFHSAPGLRPTLGRVRETLGNWLRADLPGARCLDLYAGSGALGLEALSLGAASVTFVEQHRRQAQQLRQTLAELEVAEQSETTPLAQRGSTAQNSQARVVPRDALKFLNTLPPNACGWDLIFLDPPFDGDLLQITLDKLACDHPALGDQGLVYYECPKRHEPNLSSWRPINHAQAGDTQFGLLARPASP